MSEQDATQASPLHRPPNDDTEAWKAYWKTQGQPWRTEKEIDAERQKHLAERRRIAPDIIQGMYPFKDIKLSRADIEWLLATHESSGMRGPVDWNDERQREREGLDLRGADLYQVDLHQLPLACLHGSLTWEEWYQDTVTDEQRAKAAAHMQGVNLFKAQLQGSHLRGVRLQQAILEEVEGQGTDFYQAQFQGARLVEARLQGTNLDQVQLQDTELYGVQLQGAKFKFVTLSNDEGIGPSMCDVLWEGVNLTAVDWSQVKMTGLAHLACQSRKDGQSKDRAESLGDYQGAVRENRLLALALQNQGMNEEAARFAYRAQVLQRKVFWLQISVPQVKFRQRFQRLGQWLFSWFLEVVAGYGYKPYRCFAIYFLAVIGFTLAHYLVGAVAGPPLTFLNALAISVQSLHGRLFSFQSSDPQTVLNTIEAFVGLFIEAIVVAVITQRILGK